MTNEKRGVEVPSLSTFGIVIFSVSPCRSNYSKLRNINSINYSQSYVKSVIGHVRDDVWKFESDGIDIWCMNDLIFKQWLKIPTTFGNNSIYS